MADKLQIPPDQAAYVAVSGNEVLSVKLDGGASRYRSDIIGAWSSVTAQWTLNRMQYNYLSAFFRTKTKRGAIPFLCDLYLESSEIQEFTCYFVPSTFQLISQAGLTFTVGASLEVKPPVPDPDADNALVVLYEEYGDTGGNILALLSTLVNTDLGAL